MSQLNLHMTPRFEKALKQFMRLRGIKTKSEAVRTAVEEALERAAPPSDYDWTKMIGIANKYPPTPPEQWLTDDEFWETNRH